MFVNFFEDGKHMIKIQILQIWKNEYVFLQPMRPVREVMEVEWTF